ncbi:hypothetical protein MANI_005892 [Metarhizium anisopliae]|nr:hypothetical protein MANI_005892 [Metarhizium anisopliae]
MHQKLDDPKSDPMAPLKSMLNFAIPTDSTAIPSISECAVHLLLLESFTILRRDVQQWGKSVGIKAEVAWDIFLHLAVQRFLKWSQTPRLLDGTTPPLDVLMVWHAYMLNPGAYLDYEEAVLHGQFGGKGIAWASLRDCIDMNTTAFTLLPADEAIIVSMSLDPDLLGAMKLGMVNPLVQKEVEVACSVQIDLCAAVGRQFDFSEKMYSLNWLRCPFARETLERCALEYQHFFKLIADNTELAIMPTLHVDLVWHTHQLSPASYRAYCDEVAGTFINHDDTPSPDDLAVAVSSSRAIPYPELEPQYATLTCYCWFCEAGRVSHLGEKPLDCPSGMESMIFQSVERENHRRESHTLPIMSWVETNHAMLTLRRMNQERRC